MANADLPFGLRALNNPDGNTPKVTHYTAKASVAFYEGEMVTLNTTGQLAKYSDAQAVLGNIIGVTAAPLSSTATDRSLPIYDDPNQEFEIQTDDNTINTVKEYLFRCLDVVNPTTGNTTLLNSICEIDGSVTPTLLVGDVATHIRPLYCVGASKNVQNTDLTTNSRFICIITPPCHLKGMGSVGVGTATVMTSAFGGRENA